MIDLPLRILLGTFVGGAIVTFALTPAVAGMARRFGALDHPGGRHVHLRAVPRIGGMAVFAGLAVGALFYGVSFGWETFRWVFNELLAFLLPCLLVLAVGFVDDVRGLSPSAKLLAQAVGASFLIQAGYVIDVVGTPFGAPIHLGHLSFPLTMLWFIGITNAFNLIDGLDGLLTTVAISALLGCAAIAIQGDRSAIAILALALAGALVGFLPWNWNPARVFLGDSGSLVIGLAIAAISIKVCRNPPTPVAPSGTLALHAPLLLCALPIVETCMTVARRYASGQPYFTGDKSHIHHVLLNKGLSVRRATATLAGISLLFSTSAVLSRSWRREVVLAWLVVLLFVAFGGLRWLGYVEVRVFLERLRHGLRRRRPELPLAVGMARVGERLRDAADLAAIRDGLRGLLGEPRFAVVAIELDPDLAAPLGAAGMVEATTPEARDLLQARGARAVLVLAGETPTGGPPRTLVTFDLPLPLAEGRHARLMCIHAHALQEVAPEERDVRAYVAEPLADALRRVLWHAPLAATGPAGSAT